VKGVKQGYG
jgi:hypothetical protein